MPEKPSILVVDDEEGARESLKELLKEYGYRAVGAASGEEACEKIQKDVYDLVITDLRMEGISGIDVLKIARSQSYGPEVLLTTAYGSIESAVDAIKLGAFDYLAKPLDSKRVMVTVKQALEKKGLRSEVTNLQSQVASLQNQVKEKYSSENIIAASPEMRRVLDLVGTVSKTDSTVLIEGESGTGKELVARAIYFEGPRAKGVFTAVNCAALPEPLLESELFGHSKGSFTGALKDKKGLFEEADGGTILLDEIGGMPLPIQAKLLRALQDGEIRRLGSNTTLNVDVRIIASTNRELELLVKEGKFREDLFYRLNVIPIKIPPLRKRKEDVLPLVNHFVGIYNRKLKKEVKGFSPEALEILLNHDWPGNVRELENTVERTMALRSSLTITPFDLDVILELEEIPSDGSEAEGRHLSLSRLSEIIEKAYILKVLERNDWNGPKAAKFLNIDRSSLWRKMKKYGIDGPS